jgi:hypothetical protein
MPVCDLVRVTQLLSSFHEILYVNSLQYCQASMSFTKMSSVTVILYVKV